MADPKPPPLAKIPAKEDAGFPPLHENVDPEDLDEREDDLAADFHEEGGGD